MIGHFKSMNFPGREIILGMAYVAVMQAPVVQADNARY